MSDLDLGRLQVYEIRLDKKLKPVEKETDSETQRVRVVTLTDEPGVALPQNADLGVVFLRPLRRNSYLSQHLSRDQHYSFVDGRDGWLRTPTSSDLPQIVAPVEQLIGLSVNPRGKLGKRKRNLVFSLMRAPHPLLVHDGILSLSSVSGLAQSLTDEETAAIVATLTDSKLPISSRQKLIEEIASLGLHQLVPTLQELAVPDLQEAAWAALRKLGTPIEDDTLREHLVHNEAAIRLAAARELLTRDAENMIPRISSTVLNDPDSSVRLGVIEALGKTDTTKAVAPLEQTFAGGDLETRQAAARAMIAIGGRPAEDAFHRLAFVGPPNAQRFAAFCLLSLGVDKADPRVRDILARTKNEKLREMIEGDISVGHSH